MHCDCSRAVRDAAEPLLAEIEALKADVDSYREIVAKQDAEIGRMKPRANSCACRFQRGEPIITCAFHAGWGPAEDLRKTIAALYVERDTAEAALRGALEDERNKRARIAELCDALSEARQANAELARCVTAGQMQRVREASTARSAQSGAAKSGSDATTAPQKREGRSAALSGNLVMQNGLISGVIRRLGPDGPDDDNPLPPGERWA